MTGAVAPGSAWGLGTVAFAGTATARLQMPVKAERRQIAFATSRSRSTGKMASWGPRRMKRCKTSTSSCFWGDLPAAQACNPLFKSRVTLLIIQPLYSLSLDSHLYSMFPFGVLPLTNPFILS